MVGLSPNLRPMVGLYGNTKMVQDLPSIPSLDQSTMDRLSMDRPSMDRSPPDTNNKVNSVALHDSRQSFFRLTTVAPSSEDSAWTRHTDAEVDTRKKAKQAMLSGFANIFK